MAVVLTNNFEGGTNTTTISTANSGGTSGSAFDSVSIGASATVQFSNVQAAHGGLSAQLVEPGSAVNAIVIWTTSLTIGTINTVWMRAYIWIPSNPANAIHLLEARNGSTLCGAIGIGTSGNVLTFDSAGTVKTTSAATVPLNAWFRLEGYVTGSSTVGQIQVRIFTAGIDAPVPVEVNTTPPNLNTSSSINRADFGNPGSNPSYTMYVDDVGASDTGYLGPAVTSLINSFEGGVNGNAITNANAGGSTGYGGGPFTNNQFDHTVTSGTGALTFDNTHAAHGTLAAKVSSSTSADTAYARYDVSLGTQTQIWFREYLYFTGNPALNTRIFTYTNSSGTNCTVTAVNTSGKLFMTDNTGATMFTFAGAIPLNQWFRIEGTIVNSATTGYSSVSMYSQMDALGATETQNSAATFNTLASGGYAWFGLSFSTGVEGPYWMDDIGVSTVAALGPVVFPAVSAFGLPSGNPPGMIAPGAFPVVPSLPAVINDVNPPNVPYLMGSGSGGGGTSSLTVPIQVPSNPGDTIVVLAVVIASGAVLSSLTDTKNNSYSTVYGPNFGSGPAPGAGMRGGQFAAVNPIPLGIGDSVTGTWASPSLINIFVVGLPGNAVGVPGENLIVDRAAANTVAGNFLQGGFGSNTLVASQEVALLVVVTFPNIPINIPPQWNVIESLGINNNSSLSLGSIAYKILVNKPAIGAAMALSNSPTSDTIIISTYMPETRYASAPGTTGKIPDMPPGMQSPGAWQYQPLNAPEGPWSADYNSNYGQVPRTLSGTVSDIPVITRGASTTYNATIAQSGTIIKAVTHALAATLALTGTLRNAVAKMLTTAVTLTGTLVRALSKILKAAIPLAGKVAINIPSVIWHLGQAAVRWVAGTITKS